MKLHELLVPALALVLLAVFVRTQYGRVIDRATHSDSSYTIPVTTPFYSSLCGRQNQNCETFTLGTSFNTTNLKVP